MIKKVVKAIFNRMGFDVVRNRSVTTGHVPTNDGMTNGFRRLQAISIFPNAIIDVGAAEGTWTEKAALVWPEAEFLLFEPLEERKEILLNLQKRLANKIFLSFTAAGNDESEINFHVSEDLDGSGIATDINSSSNRIVKVFSIIFWLSHMPYVRLI